MIRPLPKKLTELGRIRIGDQEDVPSGKGKRPHKLDLFRLTSANKPLLHFASNLYGGEVRPWDGAPNGDQFELYTTTNGLDVLIPTASAVSVQYEIWSRGGCTRRCDGCLVTHSAQEAQVGSACLCPEDDHARAEQAKDGKACARILRLHVLLPDLPGLGAWRLETKGYYATAELLGALEMLQGAGMERTLIEAVLRLEQRNVKRYGQTRRFNVPVLWPKYTPRQLLLGSEVALLEAPAEPTPESSPQARLTALNADLFGDRDTPGPARADTARRQPLGMAIDRILREMGVSAENADAFWLGVQAKYPDITPGVLFLLHEQIVARQTATLAQHTDARPAEEDGGVLSPQDDETMSLWEQEEREGLS